MQPVSTSGRGGTPPRASPAPGHAAKKAAQAVERFHRASGSAGCLLTKRVAVQLFVESRGSCDAGVHSEAFRREYEKRYRESSGLQFAVAEPTIVQVSHWPTTPPLCLALGAIGCSICSRCSLPEAMLFAAPMCACDTHTLSVSLSVSRSLSLCQACWPPLPHRKVSNSSEPHDPFSN